VALQQAAQTCPPGERAAWEAQLAGSQGAASECRALRLRDGVPVVEVLERTDAENY